MTRTIMIRFRPKNRFNKTKSVENWSLYKTQINFCTKLLRKTKKYYFSKVNQNLYSTIKTFGEVISSIPQTWETSLTNLWFQKKTAQFLMIEDYLRFLIHILSMLLKLLKLLKIVPAFRNFFLCEERTFKFHSVSENEIRKVILNMDEKRPT